MLAGYMYDHLSLGFPGGSAETRGVLPRGLWNDETNMRSSVAWIEVVEAEIYRMLVVHTTSRGLVLMMLKITLSFELEPPRNALPRSHYYRKHKTAHLYYVKQS